MIQMAEGPGFRRGFANFANARRSKSFFASPGGAPFFSKKEALTYLK